MNREKDLIFERKEILDAMLSGSYQAYRPIGVTLGTHGKYVNIQMENGKWRSTKDGVSVAKEIKLPNPTEDSFAQAIIDASMMTLSELGDGTTSTAVMAYYMIKYAHDVISKNEKTNLRMFIKGMDKAKEDFFRIHESLKEDNKPTKEDLIKVATTSANGDENLGTVIGEIYDKVGSEGLVKVSYKDEDKITVDYAKGYIIDEGLLGMEFINHNGMCLLNNPLVLVTNKPIEKAKEFMEKFMDYAMNKERDLLVVAGDYSREVLQTIVKNLKHVVCCPTKAPSTGENKNSYLEDIARVTGAVFINGEKDMFWEDLDPEEVLGTLCEKAEVKIDETVLYTDKSVDHEEYCKKLEDLAESTESDYAKEFTMKRIAKINGNIATINLSKTTLREMSFDYDRADDAVKATRNTIKNGIMAGGGKVYIHIASIFDKEKENDNKDFNLGYDCIRKSFYSVTTVSLQNAMFSDEEIEEIISKLYTGGLWYGYDTMNDKFGDMKELGVLESYSSSKTCFKNAFSVAKTMINTGCCINFSSEIF